MAYQPWSITGACYGNPLDGFTKGVMHDIVIGYSSIAMHLDYLCETTTPTLTT
jgi:hypothetical protein